MEAITFILSIIAASIPILAFFGGIARWCIKSGIVNPLRALLLSLQKTVDKLNSIIIEMQKGQHNQEMRISILEEQMKVANHRIGDLEEVTKKCNI